MHISQVDGHDHDHVPGSDGEDDHSSVWSLLQQCLESTPS